MTTDRRELVLVRLLAILANVPPIQVVVRNRGELPADKRPAIVLLDADEVARLQASQSRGRLIAAPCLVDMTPEIYVVMDAREPPNELIGTDMNTMRDRHRARDLRRRDLEEDFVVERRHPIRRHRRPTWRRAGRWKAKCTSA